MSERKADIDKERIINHWIESSDEDYETMITLYKSKSYGWALFLVHISTEKLLRHYMLSNSMIMLPLHITYTD